MIQVVGLEKSFGPQKLFSDATFTIADGERIGLIGRNGHGKSTLFRILTGEEQPDGGDIIMPKNHKVGHLSQHIKFDHPTVFDEACSTLPRYEGGWFESYKAEQVLAGLGIEEEHWQVSPQKLSGGFQVRLNLAKVLLAEPNLLLLDEPTNYLDIVSMRWLQGFLKEWEHELILITHDREFMDSVTTHTVMIHRCQIRKLEGGTQKLMTQILQEEEIHEKTRVNEEKRRASDERFIARFKAQASRARAVQSRIKLLDKREKLEKLTTVESLEFSFRSAPFPGRWLMRAEDICFGYRPEEPLISNLTLAISKSDRVGVIGRNGRGKTTLLNLLAGERDPLAGEITRSPNLQMGYFGQTNVDRLRKENTIEDEIYAVQPNLNRTAVRSICGAMMFEGDNALKPISVLSGGERSRVLLGKILVTPANLLLLDEPTNHLDMESVDSLVAALDEFDGAIVIVTHSEMILRAVCNRLVVFDRDTAQMFEGTYDDFLESRGWSGEPEPTGKKAAAPTSSGRSAPVASKSEPESSTVSGKEALKDRDNSKEARKERADARARKKHLIRPVENEIARIEARIVECEEIVKTNTDKLITIDPGTDAAGFSQLSKELSKAQSEIEKLFSSLEIKHAELEKLNSDTE